MNVLFDRLREIVLRSGQLPAGLVQRLDLVPLDADWGDGWYCLRTDGAVVHVGRDGTGDETVSSRSKTTAFIGNLARRFPLATWFVPRASDATTCPGCGGAGTLTGLPANAVCRCGGLGWLPVEREE